MLTPSFSTTVSPDDYHKITFTGASAANVIKWEWDLGDGSVENQKSFTHTYKKDGDYNVTLVVYGDGGVSDKTKRTVTVSRDSVTSSQGSSGGDGEEWTLTIADYEFPVLAFIGDFVRLLKSLFAGTLFGGGE